MIAAVRDGEVAPPGADAVVTLTPGTDWAGAFRDAAGGSGIDAIVDPVWGEPALAAIKAAARGAVLVQIGHMAGETLTIPAPLLRSNQVDISGHAIFHAPVTVRREGYRRLTEHTGRGDIQVPHETVPLSAVARVWERQKTGARTKLVLIP